MNASVESDAEAGARMANYELRLAEIDAEVRKAEIEVRKAEIDAELRKAEIELRKAEIELRKAEIDAEVRKAVRAEAKAKKEAESYIASAIIIVLSTITHSLTFCYFMEAFGTAFLESIRSAWIARFLTTLKSSGLYQVIVFMFEFLSRVGKRLLLKSQTANTPVSDEVNPLLGSVGDT